MKNIFISSIKINKVRHLNNLQIDIAESEKKYLIITGKNGKTSLLDSMNIFFDKILNFNDPIAVKKRIHENCSVIKMMVDKYQKSANT